MAQTASNVSAAKPKVGGAVYTAATNATLPTSADGALATGWTSLGYLSEDGVTNSNSPNTDTINAWGGDPVLTLYNAKEDTFKFKLLEVLNPDVPKAVYGSTNVSGTLAAGITINVNNKELETKAYVIDMIMRNGALKRIVIPAAQVSAIGDVVYTDSDAVAYEVTISAQADASGNTYYEYIKAASSANG